MPKMRCFYEKITKSPITMAGSFAPLGLCYLSP